MNLTTFDPTKPCHTKEGGEAEYVCELNDPQYPHGFKFRKANGLETVSGFTVNGRYSNDAVDDKWDLVNDGERIQVTCWLNVFENKKVYSFQNKEAADAHAPFYPYPRVACIECPIDVPKP